jgi:hypothetical protein
VLARRFENRKERSSAMNFDDPIVIVVPPAVLGF